MDLLLIRHALPLRIENPDGSPANPALSPLGVSQAERMARWLAAEKLDALYASPLRRAHETALPLSRATGLEVELEPGVREFDPDAASYIPMEELKATDYPRWIELVQGGLELAADFDAFSLTVVETLERLIARNTSRRIAVVCHGGVINAWASHVVGRHRGFFFEPDYTSIHRFVAARTGERMLVSLNEAAHLRD